MDDLDQIRFDVLERQIEDLSTECAYYKKIASHWRDIAFQLMSIEKLHDEFECDMLCKGDGGF